MLWRVQKRLVTLHADEGLCTATQFCSLESQLGAMAGMSEKAKAGDTSGVEWPTSNDDLDVPIPALGHV